MDFRDLEGWCDVLSPVEVENAHLSLGDTHAAQGDGRVCGTPVESAMDVMIRVPLLSDSALAFPRFEISGPRRGDADRLGVSATAGLGPDLMQATRDAVSEMMTISPEADPFLPKMPTCCARSLQICAFPRSSTRPTGSPPARFRGRSSPTGHRFDLGGEPS